MNAVDLIILGSAAFSCVCFFLLQVLIFRRVHPEAVFNSIMGIFNAASFFHVGVVFFLFRIFNPDQADYGFGIMVLVIVVSYFLFALAAFVYILCIFGPSETSIRIRVVRELAESKGRLLHDQMLERYNGRMILERRLKRFLQSGEIKLEHNKYVFCKSTNVFFMIDIVAKLIQKIVGKSS